MALAGLLAPRKLYYGWYIVALGFLAQFVISGSRTFAMTVFLKPMVAELGWSRANFVSGFSLEVVILGLMMPLIGPLLDRRGARGLMAAGAIVTGGSFIALSRVHALWQFYLVMGIVLPLGLLGTSPLVLQVAISNWFIKRRGMALALSSAGTMLGGASLVPLAGFLITSLGWRTAWVILGLMTWLVMILPPLLLLKRRPEDVGLAPDGVPSEARRAPDPAPRASADVPWTRRQALATPALWLIVIAFGFGSMSMVGWATHVVPFITDIGFSTSIATSVMTVHLLFIAATLPGWGLLADRVEAKYIGIGAFLLSATALLLLFFVVPRQLAAIYGLMIVLGLGYGAIMLVQPVLWANYYGRLSLGTVRSIGMFFTTAFSAVGPLFAAYIFDVFKSYDMAFGTFAALALVAAFLIFLLRPPRHPTLS